MSIQLVQNDTGFELSFTIKDGDGNAYDLTGASVEFHLSDKAFENKVSGACSITDAEAGLCKYTVQDGDLDLTPGKYLGELQITAAGKVVTNPIKFQVEIVGECG
jgi:hypothetical protein